MFDRISRRYDFLNHLLSMGMDILWRRSAVDELRGIPEAQVLDLACGTGDLFLTALERIPAIRSVWGIDPSAEMLDIAADKINKKSQHNGKVILLRGNGLSIPLKSDSLNAAMIAFGIRNIPDPSACLTDIYRVLKPGGKLIVLEFSLPANRLMKKIYLSYFRHILPFLGGMISGDFQAYRYLNRTVENFPYGEDFLNLMQRAGFRETTLRNLSMGIAAIYMGYKT